MHAGSLGEVPSITVRPSGRLPRERKIPPGRLLIMPVRVTDSHRAASQIYLSLGWICDNDTHRSVISFNSVQQRRAERNVCFVARGSRLSGSRSQNINQTT